MVSGIVSLGAWSSNFTAGVPGGIAKNAEAMPGRSTCSSRLTVHFPAPSNSSGTTMV